MGKLEELEEELYSQSGSGRLKKRTERSIDLFKESRKLPTSWLHRELPPKPEGGLSRRRLFKVFLGALVIMLLAGGSIFVFLYLGTKGEEARLTIEGREEIQAGEEITIPIVFKNLSRAALEEVELSITLPRDSLLVENGIERPAPPLLGRKISNLGPGEEAMEEIAVRFLGQEGDEKKVEATLQYRPQDLRARFSVRGSKLFKISRVPLAIFWEVPPLLSRGQEVEIKMRYNSSASASFNNMFLKLDYPLGFNFVSAVPQPDIGDTIWQLGTLASGQEGLIFLRGVITGEEDEMKTFKAELGFFDPLTKEWRTYSESSQDTKIAVTPLAVQGFLENSRGKIINPGERLRFSLRFKNNTEFPLKNISLRAGLEGDILDLSSLTAERGGVFDFNSRAVVWDSAGWPELAAIAAGAGGEVSFSVATRDRPLVRGPQDKNLKVILLSAIETAGVPSELAQTELRSEERLEFKVNSKITFSARALYRSSPILNSGPLPPKVGIKTAYVILWEIRNFTNDLQNAEIKTKLPANVKWENSFWPGSARVVFDEATSEVRWLPGLVKAGTGVTSPALTAAFQVSLTPSEADLGQSPGLINESGFSAADTFTNQNLQGRADALSTRLMDDPSTNFKEWQVVN